MTARRFVDTNILLYAVSTSPGEKAKAEAARRILESDDLGFSMQVFQEFYVQATHPARAGRTSHENALEFIRELSGFPVQEIDLELFEAAVATKHRFGISYWDAAVIEAARALGCLTVLSEDLSGRQDYGGVRVMNPFVAAP